MSERVPDTEKKRIPNKHGRFGYGGGLWMDEMVDKMMEKGPSAYVGFHCTYKRDLGKRTTGS
jgi:hypothetical protein